MKMKRCRLQELEDQYRKEREEASNLLEQQRLVGARMIAIDHKKCYVNPHLLLICTACFLPGL